jgi:UDP:flavonoid glycosyltransferase YjiC (YdhE family)
MRGAGHDVAFYTASSFRERIESSGLRFFPLPIDVDIDMRDIDAAFPRYERYQMLDLVHV